MLFQLRLFRRFIWRDVIKNWTRTTLTVAGIALGVSVLIAISLANHTALGKFKETIDLVSGKANLEIHSASTPLLDKSVLQGLQWIQLVGGKFSPLVRETIVINSADKRLAEFIGIDMLADRDFKTYSDSESGGGKSDSGGTKGDSDGGKSQSYELLNSRQVLIGSKLAATEHLHTGSQFEILVNEKPQLLKVCGVISGQGLGGVYSGNLIIADMSVAQQVLQLGGKITSVELIVPEDKLKEIQQRLTEDLPPSVVAARPSQRGEQVEKMTRSFEYNLLALTFIALMVGMFLIYNTMTISVIRRRPEIGVLRAIGVRRSQIQVLFFLEALGFGFTGSGIGIALGLLMSSVALKAVAGTFQHFYFQDPIETVQVAPQVLLFALLTGVGLTLAASLPPIHEATTVSPAEATRRASYETKFTRASPALAICAGLLFILAAWCSSQSPVNDFPVYGYSSAVCLILGASLIVPLLLKITLPFVGRLLKYCLGFEGLFAARSLDGALGRTAVAVASLMIGIAMMISLGIMIGSFRRTVLVWIDQTLQADLWMQSAARAEGSRMSRLDESVIATVAQIPGVDAVDGFSDLPFEYEGEATNLGAGDISVIQTHGHLMFTSGESNAAVLSRMQNHCAIVSEAFAIRRNIHEGDTLSLPTPSGPYPVKVQGIYYNYASDLGYIVIPRSVYRDLFADHTISNCAIYLKNGANAEEVKKQIENKIHTMLLSIRTTGQLRSEAIKIFDRTFSITYALHTIAIVISMLAITNSLYALTMESRREFGVLRYMGADAAQIRKIVLAEAGILGMSGNIGGVALGFVLSLLLIFVINRQSFGWTVQLSIPYEFILQSSAMVLIASLVAGVLPARLAARTLSPSVVRDE